MALISKGDFAEKCGIESKHISTYVNRKKIVLTGKMINIELPVNMLFLASKELKNHTTPQKKPQKKETNKSLKNGKKLDKNPENTHDQGVTGRTKAELFLDDLSVRKEIAAVEKIESESKLKKVQVDTANGLLIPREMLEANINSLFRATIMNLKQMIEERERSLLRIMPKDKESRDMIVQHKESLTKDINNMINKSVEDAKSKVEEIVKESSNKRGRGER